MSKHLKEKILLNCGRKRKMTRGEAKSQVKARLSDDPKRPVRIYRCEKCKTYHTTTVNGGISKSIWSKL